jgi:hypothetical protein
MIDHSMFSATGSHHDDDLRVHDDDNGPIDDGKHEHVRVLQRIPHHRPRDDHHRFHVDDFGSCAGPVRVLCLSRSRHG